MNPSVFPPDILGLMKDCILALVYPKKDIVRLFRDHGALPVEIGTSDPSTTRRDQIVDLVFDAVRSRPDSGLGFFRALLHTLVEWKRFDPYYFDQLKKLDRAAAERAIEALKSAQVNRDEKLAKERARREQRESDVTRVRSLDALREEFLNLHSGKTPPQKRGYALERILTELGRLEGLEVVEPFRERGEQIDGSVKIDGEHYLIEAKWQDAALSNEPVYQFAGKTQGKFYGRGFFISIQGFSPKVVESLVVGKALSVLSVDGGDITLVIDGRMTFTAMLTRKVREAQTRGNIYVDPFTGKSKVVLRD